MGYTSLKDLYSKQIKGIILSPLQRQLLAEQDEARVFVPGNVYVGNQTWAAYGVSPEVFEKEATPGQGRGEYSVACVLWGLKSKEEVEAQSAQIIQGTQESFDVQGRDGGRYEVKQIGKSVKTGVEGREVLSEIITEVTDFLNDILKAYITVDEHGKQTINNSIMNSEVVKQDIINDRANSKYFSKIKNSWTLEGYLKDVLSKVRRGELARGILLFNKLRLSDYVPESRGRPDVIFSFKQLVDVLNEVASGNITASDQPGELNVAVKDIYDTLSKHYKIHNDDREKNFFEKEAESIDRDLTQKQCKVFQKCTDTTSFIKTIKSLRLSEKLQKITGMTSSIVERIFPGQGLFLVDKQGFDYIPRQLLNQYVEFDTISGSAVKIKRKNNPPGHTDGLSS